MYKPEKSGRRKRILAVDDAVIILRRITDALDEFFDEIGRASCRERV